MKVLIYTHCFYPEHLSALSKRMGDLARELVRAGYQITIVTAFPNHPYGKVYPGYGGYLMREEEWETGVRVLRCWSYVRPFEWGLTRVLNQVTLMASMLTLGGWRLRGYRADVVVGISPPLTAALAGVLTAKVRRVPFVLDVQDLWPEEAVAVGGVRSPVVVRVSTAVARFLYRNSARTVVISEGFARAITAQGGAAATLRVLPNWVREDAFEVRAPARLPGTGFKVLFAGTMGLAQGLEVAIEAAERLAKRGVSFIFVGEGVEKERLRDEALRRRLANVYFLPAVAQEQPPAVLAAADALLVHLRPDEVFEKVIPSKTYEYLAAGRPILMGVSGEAARLVKGVGAGMTFSSGDPNSLVGVVEKLASLEEWERRAMRERGRVYARKNFTAGILTARYGRTISEVVREAAGEPQEGD